MRKIKRTILLFAALLSFPASLRVLETKAERSYPPLGEECLHNTDFSQELIPFTTVETFSDTNFTNLMVERTTVNDECRSLGGAVKLQYDSEDGHLNVNDYPAIWQDVYVKSHTYYLWSAYVKRSGPAENGYLCLGYRNPLASDKWIAVSQNIYNDTTTTYEQISILIYTNELTAIRAAIHCQCRSTGKDGFYLIDDVSLKEINIDDFIDTSSTAPTDCKIGDKSVQFVNDPGFENLGTSPVDSTFERMKVWKSFSWAGTDRNGWGNNGSTANAFLTFSNNGLHAGERPAIGQDLTLKKNTYYVVSFFAKLWNPIANPSPITVTFQDSNGVNSGTDNNTAMFKKNLDRVSFTDVGTSWVEKQAVLFTDNYVENRLVIFTTAIEHEGQINGYHVDDVRVWEVLEPEEAKLAINAGYKTGKNMNPNITVKFKDNDEFVSIPMENHVATHYEFGTAGIFIADLNNNLVPLAEGNSTVKCNVEVFGKTLTTNQLSLVVNDANINANKHIQRVDVSTAQAISTTTYTTVNVDVFDENDNYIFENETTKTVVSENKKVVFVRELTTGYHVLGISSGTSRIYATVQYNDSIGIGYVDLVVDTDNLLIDGSFEAQNEHSFWSFSGTGGGSGDDGQTNTYRRSGYANLWCMAPIFWDAHVPKTAYADIGQYVNLTPGKYALSVYINRYAAEGVEGRLSANGGLCTLSATPVDADGQIVGDVISREFDCSYGSFAYGKLSIVFDCVTASRYLVNLHIQGDAEFGYGMQVDDFELKQAVYPVQLFATLDETVTTLDIESIYSVYVYAIYEGDRREELNTDLRFFFDDFSICVYSNGYLFPKKEGETDLTIRATILDQTYETTLHLVVGGSGISQNDTNNTKLMIGLSIGGVALASIGTSTTIIVFRRKKRGV